MRKINVEAFDVIGHDHVSTNDAEAVAKVALGTLNRAFEALAESLTPGDETEAIRMTIVLEVDVNET